MAAKKETYDLIFAGVDKVTPEMKAIIDSFDRLDAQVKKSDKAIDDMAESLSDTADSAKNIDGIAKNFFGLSVAADLTSEAISEATKAIVKGLASVGVAAIKTALELDQSSQRMVAAVGAPQEKVEEFEKIIEKVFTTGIPDSVEDAAKAVQLSFQKFGDVGVEELAKVSNAATQLSKLYDSDLNQQIDAAAALTKDFGLTSDQAFDFIAAGFQNGLNSSDDFLDTIREYSTQFKDGGASAGEFFSLLESGLGAGVLGTDKVADSFKELNDRIFEGSDAARKGLNDLGLDSDKIYAGIRKGVITTAQVYDQVVASLAKIDDPIKREAAAVALLGEQFKDVGREAFKNISLAGKTIDDLAGSFDKTSAAFEDVATSWAKIWRKSLVEITNLEPFEKLVEGVAYQFSEMGKNFDEAIKNVDFSTLEKSVKDLIDSLSGGFSDIFGDIDLTTVEGLQVFIQKIVDGIAGILSGGAKLADGLVPILIKVSDIFRDINNSSTATGEVFLLIGKIGEALFLAIQAVGASVLSLLTGTVDGIAQVGGVVATVVGVVSPAAKEIAAKIEDFRKGLAGFNDQLKSDAMDKFKKATDAGGEAMDIFAGKTAKAVDDTAKLTKNTAESAKAVESLGVAAKKTADDMEADFDAIVKESEQIEDGLSKLNNISVEIEAKLYGADEAIRKSSEISDSIAGIDFAVEKLTARKKELELGIKIGNGATPQATIDELESIKTKIDSLTQEKKLVEIELRANDAVDGVRELRDTIKDDIEAKHLLEFELQKQGVGEVKTFLSEVTSEGRVITLNPEFDKPAVDKVEKIITSLEEDRKFLLTIESKKYEEDTKRIVVITEQAGETARKALEVKAEVDIAQAVADTEKFTSIMESTTSIVTELSGAIGTMFGQFSKDLDFYQMKLLEESIRQQIRIQDEAAEGQKELIKLELEKRRLQNEFLRNPDKAIFEIKFESDVEPALEYLLRYMLQKTRIFGTEYGVNQLLEVPI